MRMDFELETLSKQEVHALLSSLPKAERGNFGLTTYPIREMFVVTGFILLFTIVEPLVNLYQSGHNVPDSSPIISAAFILLVFSILFYLLWEKIRDPFFLSPIYSGPLKVSLTDTALDIAYNGNLLSFERADESIASHFQQLAGSGGAVFSQYLHDLERSIGDAGYSRRRIPRADLISIYTFENSGVTAVSVREAFTSRNIYSLTEKTEWGASPLFMFLIKTSDYPEFCGKMSELASQSIRYGA